MSPKSAFESTTFDADVTFSVDESMGSASISPSGRDVALGSRNGLYILDLDDPYSPPRHIPHRSPWEVADVQWSPHASRDHWIVTTSNQKALVWNLNLSSPHAPIEHVLHAHQRAITDINFAGYDPDILATCAVDSFVYCWDLRTPKLPVMSLREKSFNTITTPNGKFADWHAGATQVKWNRLDPNILASSHDKYLRIWDWRKGAIPVRTIEAHSTKIYGIDWNRTLSSRILTCSLDYKIKFWDYSSTEDDGKVLEPEREICTPYPVWRARHTPFGLGVLVMPQRGDFNLHLYDRRIPDDSKNPEKSWQPSHSFEGHNDQVKEFLWRTRGGIDDGTDQREFQLVSWGMDKKLQLHKITPEILSAVGHEKGRQIRTRFNFSRKGAVYKSYKAHSDDFAESHHPQQENVPQSHLTTLFKTAGMNKAPLPGIHSFQQKSFMTTGSGMQGRNMPRKNLKPITWMAGVKIGKREPGSGAKAGAKSNTPNTASQFNWDSPESLGDEISYVGNKFKRVEFEVADVSRRTAVVSLKGPWGVDGKPTFIRLSLNFPSEYPRSMPPQFRLEKTTSSLSDDTLAKLQVEIHAIAESYKNRRKGCLEAIISYLLGERGLDESTNWLSDSDEAGLGNGAESSSSDEEDAEYSAAQQDLELSGSDLLSSVNTNANVPLPKACGATWAEDGRLVCFFPPKQEPKPLFSLAALRGAARHPKNPRIFEPFGRLQTESPDARNKYDDDSDSSSPGSLTSESTGSSSSSEDLDPVRNGFKHVWRGSGAIRFGRASQNSSIPPGNRYMAGKPKSVVSLHNVEDVLPFKRSLAEEYEIFGDGPATCAHNSDVARRHGFLDIANVWTLAGLILADNVPLEVMEQDMVKEDILIVAKRVPVLINLVDIAYNSVQNPFLTGRVKWGFHPFAGAKLIPKLLEYYEAQGNVQMLAMLCCVFAEPAGTEGIPTARGGRHRPSVPMSMKAPAFSLDYFASSEIAQSLLDPMLSSPPPANQSASQLTPVPWEKYERKFESFGSAGSSNGHFGSDTIPSGPTTPHSTNTTPPFSHYSAFRSSGHGSFSSSPEQHHGIRKSASNLGGALASLTRFVPPSPPSQARIRFADAELSSSAPTSGVTWGKNSFYSSEPDRRRSPSSRHRKRRSAQYYERARRTFDEELTDGFETTQSGLTDDDEDSIQGASDDANESDYDDHADRQSEQAEDIVEDIHVEITLKNQGNFDDEGVVGTPLLRLKDAWLHHQYRRQYSDQLLAWGLPIKASEVLKFNGLTSYWPDEAKRDSQNDSGNQASKMNLLKPPNPILSANKFQFNPEASAFFPSSSFPVTTADTLGNTISSPSHLHDSVSDRGQPLSSSAISLSALGDTTLQSSFISSVAATELPSLVLIGKEQDTTASSTPNSTIHRPSIGADSPPQQRQRQHHPNNDQNQRSLLFHGAEGRTCVVCWSRIRALYVYCYECNHAAHAECLDDVERDKPEVHGAAGGEGYEYCRSGCGCVCGHASLDLE